MNARSKKISKLKSDAQFRASYLRAKLNINVPSQLRALRLRRNFSQTALAKEAGMKQSRISAMERPGETNFNLETLVRLAAAFKVGLIVRFAPFSELLDWENRFSQDIFDVVEIDEDVDFLRPAERHDSEEVISGKYAGNSVLPFEAKKAIGGLVDGADRSGYSDVVSSVIGGTQ